MGVFWGGKKCKNKLSPKNNDELCKTCRKFIKKSSNIPIIDRNGSVRTINRTYKVRPYYNPRFRRRKRMSLWQFLEKKARELRNQPTSAEVVFESKLQALGYKYTFQYPFLYKGIGGISDFYISEQRLCVEVDGGYHLEQDQKQTDRQS